MLCLLTNHLLGVLAGYLSKFYQTSFASRLPDIDRFCFQFVYVRFTRFVCNSFMLVYYCKYGKFTSD